MHLTDFKHVPPALWPSFYTYSYTLMPIDNCKTTRERKKLRFLDWLAVKK